MFTSHKKKLHAVYTVAVETLCLVFRVGLTTEIGTKIIVPKGDKTPIEAQVSFFKI